MSTCTPPSVPPQSAERTLKPKRVFRLAFPQVGWLFAAIVCVTMLVQYIRAQAKDPLKSPQLAALKQQLLLTPKDESLKEQIRALDLQVRRSYFGELQLNAAGAWLVLAGLALAFWSQHRLTPDPTTSIRFLPEGSDATRAKKAARWSVVAFGALTGIGLASLALSARTHLPFSVAGIDKVLNPNAISPGVAFDFASASEMDQNWPRFRGANGSGAATGADATAPWDGSGSPNVLWKADVPSPGFSSPIVWGDRVFLSGGDAKTRVVLCFDSRKGELLWQQVLPKMPTPTTEHPEIPDQTGYAASTMATDGRRVYAIFGNGELAAFTLDGKVVWAKSVGWPKNAYGHATSLVTWQGRLIVQIDQGEAEQNLSKLMALDGATGQSLWQKSRSVAASWATPIVLQAAGKPQIITLAVPWVMAYSAEDGTELWRAEGLANEITPSPVCANGLVLAVSPNDRLMAWKPDGQGDVSKTHLVWASEDNVPDIASPVTDGSLVFTVSTPGMLTCYDAKDGKKQWEEDLAMECQASPALSGRYLYILGAKGVTVVVDASRQFRELGRSDFAEKIYASPALARGQMFVRTVKHLICIGSAEKRLATGK